MTYNYRRYNLVLAFSTVMMSACGGGSSGAGDPISSSPPFTVPEPAAGTYVFQGSASAALTDDGSEIWRSLAGVLSRISGPVTYSDLRIDGATFGITKSTGEELIYGMVSDVAGNADFSIGRWHNGKVRQYAAGGPVDIQIGNGIAYVFAKTLPSFPLSGTMICDQKFAATVPMGFADGSSPTVTGRVDVSFSIVGATVSGFVELKDNQSTYSFSAAAPRAPLSAPNKTVTVLSTSLDQSMLLTLRGSNSNAPLAIMTYQLQNATTFQRYAGHLVLSCK